MCPKAEQLLGELAALGFGPDRVVPIAFHVDYFNDPWPDPFSDPAHSRREMAYNEVLKRKDLYFTPMMMVAGRIPMLGSDQPKALAALQEVLEGPPKTTLDLAWAKDKEGPGPSRRALKVTLAALSPRVADRELLVGVALFEDPVTTDVPKGENAGKTLTNRFAVREFRFQSARLTGGAPTTLTFPVALGPDWVAEHCGLAAFVQDGKTGEVYQAESLPWTTRPTTPEPSPRKR